MHRKRVALAAALVGVLVAGGGYVLLRDEFSGSSTPGAVPGTNRPTAPAGGGVPMEGRAPLTGLPTSQPLSRAAVTVKISNTPDAHPHRGLGDADLVFVEPIAGSTTRLAAVFHSRLPTQVGPVRSLRPMDAALIGPTRGIVADTGADGWVLKYFDQVTDVDNLPTLSVPRGTYRIDSRRRAPNHVFAQPTELLTLTKRTAPPAPYFSYAPTIAQSTAQLSGTTATSVRIGYGGSATTTWTYRPQTKRWTRAEQWAPHRLEGGAQVAADNVLVLRAVPDRGFPQAKGSMTILDLTDTSGTLQLFTAGKTIPGRWTKAGVNDPFTFTTPDNKPLLLTPGTTWIECTLPTMPINIAPTNKPY